MPIFNVRWSNSLLKLMNPNMRTKMGRIFELNLDGWPLIPEIQKGLFDMESAIGFVGFPQDRVGWLGL